MGTLRAIVLGCTLKKSPASSSAELLGRQVLADLADHDMAHLARLLAGTPYPSS
ncbi:hypothetical protein GCM10010435_28860 [Winogradskya consettensis]|uniref:Uncharacterized protein n=1 Tax=Winogradskya consettensis TaxID=113560 RepID=A0A919VVH1_9ACTN|nr:hypothetical protein [Actinoplanes consettensis]GIM70888.1 hypothetical protein Aco04nite_22650 [Actinoplanes consettensis]